MAETVVRVENIRKTFGANRVLKGIDLELRAGETTVLMGANGAGKSTLVKILSGVHDADGGRMLLGGDVFAPASPAAAMAAGVVTVHQTINDGVIADLDVASNLLLDQLATPGAGLFVNKRRMQAKARELAAHIGLEVNIRAMVADLSLADRQQVAIARAMAHQPKLLILDEPTSSLSAAEAERLFDLVDRLKAQGVSILYITHRMSDIRRVADRIASMRDGQLSGLFEEAPLDYEGAVDAMLGHRMTEIDFASEAGGAPVLELDGLVLAEGAAPIHHSFRAGEVVAITGLVGAGKTALAEVLFGQREPLAGSMTLNDEPFAPTSAEAAIARGAFLCAKDRGVNGVVPDFDLSGNITLPFFSRYSRMSFLNRSRQQARSQEMIDRLGVVCQSERDAIGSLSGGNQQKIMVARWLSEASSLLILDEPFQGVDIQARRDIGRKIRETAVGRATLVMVSELDEAFEIADRIVTMHEHALVGDHSNDAANLGAILSEVAGGAAKAAA